ncbi:unnamed protein product [Tenebrio molitor]|nr:unnamed protein product [Tenebrio molitor]
MSFCCRSTKLICCDCIKGDCQCRGQYIGEDYTCLNSIENCKIPDSDILGAPKFAEQLNEI